MEKRHSSLAKSEGILPKNQMNYKLKTKEDLSPTEIKEIKYIAAQSNGRFSLIQNLYRINLDTLRDILKNY